MKQTHKKQNQAKATSKIHTSKTIETEQDSLASNDLALGKPTKYIFDYNPSLLESVPNPSPQNDYFISLTCQEFTSLCPITQQPDFATIHINYIANKLIVESKSLKLYLFSFRNHGGFHEECVNIIANDLITLLKPRYLEVLGAFSPRGGISIHPFVNYAEKKSPFAEMAKARLWQRNLK